MSAINAGSGTGGAGGGTTNILFGGIEGTNGHQEPAERENIASIVQGEDIWHGVASQVPIPAGAGEQMSLTSTAAADNSAGTGVRKVMVIYLDGAGLEQQEEVTLTGLTAKDMIATDVTYVNRIYATEVGSNGVAVGTITIHKTGAAATVYDVLLIGGNMSLTSTYKVPSNRTLYLTGWHASISGKDKRVTLRLRATTRDGVVYDGASPVFLFIDTMNLEANALKQDFNPYVPIPSGTILKVSGWVDAPNAGAFISCEWQGYLVDNV
jgi:hypothetical protein